MEPEFTTIQISNKNKDKLDRLKVHEREPYDDVLGRLLDDLERIRK